MKHDADWFRAHKGRVILVSDQPETTGPYVQSAKIEDVSPAGYVRLVAFRSSWVAASDDTYWYHYASIMVVDVLPA